MTTITPVKSLVASPKREVEVRLLQHAFKKQQAGAATVIDVRDIRELWREGRVAVAFHAPLGMLEF